MSTPLKNEVTRETVEFEHFGRTWSVPAKQRLSHMEKLREGFRQTSNLDLAMVYAYLDDDQLAALREVDPSEDELDRFTDAIAEAMGFKSAGNS